MGNNLTDKQKRFCDEYLVDFNATQAAIRSGYSKKTAEVQSSRLLRNVKVQEFISNKQKKTANKFEITQDRILQELFAIAFSDIRAYFDENSRMRSIHSLDDKAAAALSSVEVDELFAMTMDGRVQVGDTKKIRRFDKIKAIEVINKMLGYNAPEEKKLSGQITTINSEPLTTEKIKEIAKNLEDGF